MHIYNDVNHIKNTCHCDVFVIKIPPKKWCGLLGMFTYDCKQHRLIGKKIQPSLPSCLQIPVTFWEDQETTEIEEQFLYIDAYNGRLKKMMKHK